MSYHLSTTYPSMSHHISFNKSPHLLQLATRSPSMSHHISFNEPPHLLQWATTSLSMSHHISLNESPHLTYLLQIVINMLCTGLSMNFSWFQAVLARRRRHALWRAERGGSSSGHAHQPHQPGHALQSRQHGHTHQPHPRCQRSQWLCQHYADTVSA